MVKYRDILNAQIEKRQREEDARKWNFTASEASTLDDLKILGGEEDSDERTTGNHRSAHGAGASLNGVPALVTQSRRYSCGADAMQHNEDRRSRSSGRCCRPIPLLSKNTEQILLAWSILSTNTAVSSCCINDSLEASSSTATTTSSPTASHDQCNYSSGTSGGIPAPMMIRLCSFLERGRYGGSSSPSSSCPNASSDAPLPPWIRLGDGLKWSVVSSVDRRLVTSAHAAGRFYAVFGSIRALLLQSLPPNPLDLPLLEFGLCALIKMFQQPRFACRKERDSSSGSQWTRATSLKEKLKFIGWFAGSEGDHFDTSLALLPALCRQLVCHLQNASVVRIALRQRKVTADGKRYAFAKNGSVTTTSSSSFLEELHASGTLSSTEGPCPKLFNTSYNNPAFPDLLDIDKIHQNTTLQRFVDLLNGETSDSQSRERTVPFLTTAATLPSFSLPVMHMSLLILDLLPPSSILENIFPSSSSSIHGGESPMSLPSNMRGSQRRFNRGTLDKAHSSTCGPTSTFQSQTQDICDTLLSPFTCFKCSKPISFTSAVSPTVGIFMCCACFKKHAQGLGMLSTKMVTYGAVTKTQSSCLGTRTQRDLVHVIALGGNARLKQELLMRQPSCRVGDVGDEDRTTECEESWDPEELVEPELFNIVVQELADKIQRDILQCRAPLR